MSEPWRNQQRLGKVLLAAFLAAVVVLWAAAPVRELLSEKLLGNIALARESGFDGTFGAFPELVKDQGGSQPVALQADTPLRTPEYRGLAWLRQQDAKAYTLQVAVFADERSAGNFLGGRNDREQFVYFQMPDLPDPALPADPDASVNMRFVVAYGNFPSRADADEVAAALRDLPSAPLSRSWGGYQAVHAAMPAPAPVSLQPLNADAASALPAGGAREPALPASEAGAGSPP